MNRWFSLLLFLSLASRIEAKLGSSAQRRALRGKDILWNNGPQTKIGSQFPLGHCEGDCDSNEDCDIGLVCDPSRSRNVASPVPGCSISPTEDSGTDFCVYPSDLAEYLYSSVPTSSPTYSVTYNDDQASEGPSSPPTATQSYNETSYTDQNSERPSSPPIVESYFNGTLFADHDFEGSDPLVWIADDPDESEAYLKLGLCEGDCDSDFTCGEGLMCWQRNGTESVPGCKNGGDGDRATKDYCVLEKFRGDDGNRFYFPSDEIFRLKLYWEKGYYWQEETFERRWCIDCIERPCLTGEHIYVTECSISRNDLLEFISINSTDYHLVKEAVGDMCYQRFGNRMSWQPCDGDELDQHWKFTDLSGTSVDPFIAEKFEIRPRRKLDDKIRCVTQRHHPKHAEWMELEPCDKAVKDETSLWQKY